MPTFTSDDLAGLRQLQSDSFDQTCTIKRPTLIDQGSGHFAYPALTSNWIDVASAVPCRSAPVVSSGVRSEEKDTAGFLTSNVKWGIVVPIGTPIAAEDRILVDGDPSIYEISGALDFRSHGSAILVLATKIN